MSEGISKPLTSLPLAEASRWLNVDEDAVRGLVDAGYLKVEGGQISLAEIKAFLARNAEGGAGGTISEAAERTDPQSLIDALDSRADELASEAHTRFARAIPEALKWTPAQQTAFVEQAKSRFIAILAVTTHGDEVAASLRDDLELVGAKAAFADSSLPHLLLILRISRDVLLKTAMRLADEREGRMNASLAAFSARMLPAIDHLADAITDGYWGAKIEQVEEEWHRLANLIEFSPYGAYESDIDGLIQYANPAFAEMLGHDRDAVIGQPLSNVLKPATDVDFMDALLRPTPAVGQRTIAVVGPDGEPFALTVDTVVRKVDGEVEGFGAIVRPAQVSAPELTRHIEELRRSLDILAEAGEFVKVHAPEMTAEQLVAAGENLYHQSDRLKRIVDELDNERRS